MTCDRICQVLEQKHFLKCSCSIIYFTFENLPCWESELFSVIVFVSWETFGYLYFLFPKEKYTLLKQKFVNLQCPLPMCHHLWCYMKLLCHSMIILAQSTLIMKLSLPWCLVWSFQNLWSETSGREQVTQLCDLLPSELDRIGYMHRKCVLNIKWCFLCWVFSLSLDNGFIIIF